MGIQWNRWIGLGAGLRLCLYDYALSSNEDVYRKRDSRPEFEIDFTLSGRVRVQVMPPKGETSDFFIRAGTNGLYFLPAMEELETRLNMAGAEAPKGVLINGDAAKLATFARRHIPGMTLPWEEDEERFRAFIYEHNAMTPAMDLIIEQILSPPVERGFESLYIEGKALELIALKLSQRARPHHNSDSIRLTTEDRHRLRRARQILLSHLENPPTIAELSRLAGINDFKLKAGFRQVFGDTVFRTLKTARMQTARRLFDETGDNVLQVANRVGYTNPSHFAAAFRQCFGMAPSTYLARRNHRQAAG